MFSNASFLAGEYIKGTHTSATIDESGIRWLDILVLNEWYIQCIFRTYLEHIQYILRTYSVYC